MPYHAPLIEPTIPQPILLPTNDSYLNIEYETSFPDPVRNWMRDRDNRHCMFPVIEDGLFKGFLYDTTKGLEAHHILPEHYWKQHHPEDYEKGRHQSPLNGIMLSHEAHLTIHSAWRRRYDEEFADLPVKTRCRYGSVERYIQSQAQQGRQTWLHDYDKYFYAIATINTWEYIQGLDDRISRSVAPTAQMFYSALLQKMPQFVESYYNCRRS